MSTWRKRLGRVQEGCWLGARPKERSRRALAQRQWWCAVAPGENRGRQQKQSEGASAHEAARERKPINMRIGRCGPPCTSQASFGTVRHSCAVHAWGRGDVLGRWTSLGMHGAHQCARPMWETGRTLPRRHRTTRSRGPCTGAGRCRRAHWELSRVCGSAARRLTGRQRLG